MPKIVFFDVDNTLMRGLSGFYTTLLLIRRGILKKRRLFQALYYRISGPPGKTNLKKIYEIAASDMAGWALKDILELGRECFERWVKPRLYQEAVEEIRQHQKEGRPVYLVTSGPYMTIQILADYLGVDGTYSAGPVIDSKGMLTKDVRMPIGYREGKVEIASLILKKHGLGWKDSCYYGDSIDDVFLLEKVKQPFLVNPDRKLKKIGGKKGWPILEFRRLLGRGALIDSTSIRRYETHQFSDFDQE